MAFQLDEKMMAENRAIITRNKKMSDLENENDGIKYKPGMMHYVEDTGKVYLSITPEKTENGEIKKFHEIIYKEELDDAIAKAIDSIGPIDSMNAINVFTYKGAVNSSNPLPNEHNVGDTYIVSENGTYVGVKCEIGDMIICKTKGTTQKNSDWNVIQANIDGSVTNQETKVTDKTVPIFNGTTGKIIKSSGFTIGKSIPSDAVFTDTTYNDATESDHGLMTAEMVTKLNNIQNPENTDNKVTSITLNSTDTQYPTAKAVYTELQKVFQSGSDGKNSIEFAITAQGGSVNKSENIATFYDLYEAILNMKNNALPSFTITEKNKWYTDLTPMNEKRNNFSCVSIGKYIYAIGGWNGKSRLDKVERYDTEINKWEDTIAPLLSRVKAFGACKANGLIYVFGGRSTGEIINKVQVYDPGTNIWTYKTDMPVAKGAFTPICIDNKIYCIGGYSSTGYAKFIYVYNIKTDTWSTSYANIPTKVSNYFSGISEKYIYIIGGKITSTPFNTNYCYNIKTNTWTIKTSLPSEKYGGVSATINNKIYCVNGTSKTVYIYNMNTDTWSNGANTSITRNLCGGSLVNGIIYCIGGAAGTNVEITSDDIYNTVEAYVPE